MTGSGHATSHDPCADPRADRHTDPFPYDDAFSRNLGWVTTAEQRKLMASRVCIAGLGGVGSIYLLTLARLGVGVDGLDFFALPIRRQGFALCRANGIPAVTVTPLGMGAALLDFLPGGMSFEDYFQFEGCNAHEQSSRFLVGLSPAMLQMTYPVVPSRVDLANGPGPSTVIAVQWCSGIAVAQVLKLVFGRGDAVAAPRGLHFDAYRNRLRRTWRPGGSRNVVQRVLLAVARQRLKAR